MLNQCLEGLAAGSSSKKKKIEGLSEKKGIINEIVNKMIVAVSEKVKIYREEIKDEGM